MRKISKWIGGLDPSFSFPSSFIVLFFFACIFSVPRGVEGQNTASTQVSSASTPDLNVNPQEKIRILNAIDSKTNSVNADSKGNVTPEISDSQSASISASNSMPTTGGSNPVSSSGP